MKRLIQTFADSQHFQDLAGVARGIYKVSDGLCQNHQNSGGNPFFEEKVNRGNNKQNQQQQQQQFQQQTQFTEEQFNTQYNIKQEESKQPQQEQKQKINQEQFQSFINTQKQNHSQYDQIKEMAQQKIQQQQEQQQYNAQQKKSEKLSQEKTTEQPIQQEKNQQNKEEIIQKSQKTEEKQPEIKQEAKIDLENQEVKVKNPLEDLNIQEQLSKNQEKNIRNENIDDQGLDFEDVFGADIGNVGQEQKVPEGAFSRAYNFGMLGASIAGGAMKSYMATKLTGKEAPKSYLLTESNAEAITKSLCKMRGAPLKLGQALSIQDDDLIPKEIRQAFDKARQSADIMPKSQLYYMLEKELGKDWKNNFAEFDDKPIAAASIGQVHRAQLKNGRFVALKIQYPGVKESIDSDLSNIKRLFDWTGFKPKGMFVDQLLANTRMELMQECDYKLELQKQEKMRELVGNDKQYFIPNVYPELSSERIFTSDFILGDNLEYIADHYPQELKNDIGKRIMQITLKELFEWHYMQTDPNPSNFFFNKKLNTLQLIDFGACHAYRTSFMNDYTELVHAATIDDKQTVIDKSIALGFLSGQESEIMLDAHIKTIKVVAEPFAYEGEYDFGGQSITGKTYDLIPVMLKHRIKAPPPETYSLHRKFSGAFLLNMRMGSKFDCRELFVPLYEQYLEKKKNNNANNNN